MRLLCRQYTISPILIVFYLLIEQGLLINSKNIDKDKDIDKDKNKETVNDNKKNKNEKERGKIKSYTKRKN